LSKEEGTNALPYEMIGYFYDYLMSHVNYKEWAKFIDKLLKKEKLENSKVLDISCGTGTLPIILYKNGYNVSGCDLSHKMISKAAAKVTENGYRIDFFRCDMKNLAIKKKFNALICLYDSINYILTTDDFIATLHQIYQLLSDDGIFIFDICTEYNSIEHFLDFYDSGETELYYYHRHSFFTKETMLQTNVFRILSKQKNRIFLENHTQRIYTVDEIESMVSKTKFNIIGKYSGYTFRKPNSKSERIHFILKKYDSN